MKIISIEMPVPDWVTHIATNDDGTILGFSAEPEPQEDGWWLLQEGSEITLSLGNFDCPNWQQSLRKV